MKSVRELRGEGLDDAQNSYNSFPIPPSHLLDQFDTRKQIARAARAQKESIIEHEVARHANRLGVRYPGKTAYAGIRKREETKKRIFSDIDLEQITGRMNEPECIVDDWKGELEVFRKSVYATGHQCEISWTWEWGNGIPTFLRRRCRFGVDA